MMYGLVLYVDGKIFAAVSPSKRKLDAWAKTCQPFQDAPATSCAWRERDKSGWCGGCRNAHMLIQDFPASAQVIW